MDIERSVPSIFELQPILFDENLCLRYLIEKQVIPDHKRCPKCRRNMTLSSDMENFICPDQNCRKSVSIRRGSIFFTKNVPLNKILFLGLLWLNKTGVNSAISLSGLSSITVVNYFKEFKDSIENSLEDTDEIIGGNGIYVQIDECKFGKRKYNRGHHVGGAWVVGGVELTDNKKVFLVEVPDRSMNTLNDVIISHVKPGSIIITDGWRGYNELNIWFEHLVVNHSVNYVDPETGATTNSIEGTWNAIKHLIPPRNRTLNIRLQLSLFIWRRIHKQNLWNAFLNAITR